MLCADSDVRNDRLRSLRNLFLTLNWMSYRQLVQCLQAYNLTHPQFVTLFALMKHQQPATMTELAEVAVQDAPTMTGVVNRLVKSDLVRRTRDKEDRRVVLVEITPTGLALVQKIIKIQEADDVEGLALMSEEELNHLELALDHILQMYLHRKTKSDDVDLEILKQNLQSFVIDPINFIKTHQLQIQNQATGSMAYETKDMA